MFKGKLFKKISALTLAAAMVVSAAAVSPAAGKMKTVDAASSKIDLITSSESNYGDKVKYSYNKKGLVSKIVSKSSSKDSDSDTTTTTTTTYKYNKKNKIDTETAKTVEKVTYYETDKTTGLTIKGKQGTVTTTSTTVTKYTYNKKGQATQSVSTYTYTKSGSTTSTSKTSIYSEGHYDDEDDYNSSGTEMKDGKLIAGYNYRNADGTSNSEDTVNNAYYYVAAPGSNLKDTESVTTRTTTYKSNGAGKYTETEETVTSDANYTLTKNYKYYAYHTDGNGHEAVVEVTKITDDPDGYSYIDADGHKFYYYDFSRIDSVTVTVNAKSTSNADVSKTKRVEEYEDKNVTTTKYTYDKKNRVKKASTTSTYSSKNNSTSTDSTNETGKGSGSYYNSDTDSNVDLTYTYSHTYEREGISESLYQSSNSFVTTYNYDGKGRVKKSVTKEDGKEDRTSEYRSMTKSYSSKWEYKYSDGSTSSDIDEYSYDTYPESHKTVVKDGKEKDTTTLNNYVKKYNESYTERDGSTHSRIGQESVTRYSNGGRKEVDEYTRVYKYKGTSGNTTKVVETRYSFDEDNKTYGNTHTENITYDDGTTDEYSSAYYYDGTNYYYNEEALAKLDSAIKTLVAFKTLYEKTDESTVAVNPSQDTSSYTYDANGNKKTVKTSGYTINTVEVKNETYGNTIYTTDSTGRVVPVTKDIKKTYSGKSTYENSVKEGTNSLTKVLRMYSGSYGRSKNSGYELSGRTTYTLKSKSVSESTASLCKKQQWMIQNGNLNGMVGL